MKCGIRASARPDEILAGMLVIGLIGYLINGGLKACEKKFVKWRA